MTCSFTCFIRAMALVALPLAACSLHAQPQAQPQGSTFPVYVAPNARADLSAAPKGGEPLSFKSLQSDGAELLVPGVLYRPSGPARGAVVIVNAGVGWSDAREGNYGRALSSAGYAVLLIDTFSPRLISNTAQDNTKLSAQAQVRDAFAARRYLISLGYASDRTAVMGTGRGGLISLIAAESAFAKDATDRFALAIAVTPGCFLVPRAPVARVFMAIAERDDMGGAGRCQEVLREYGAVGMQVEAKTYPNASSGFDGHQMFTRAQRDDFVENFSNCRLVIEPDSRFAFQGKTYDEAGFGSLVREMRKSCMKLGGWIWTNPTQKANLTLDVIGFLDANFRK